MTGTRDEVIQGYFGVDLEVIWRTVTRNIPIVKPLIKDILDEIETA